jgi:DNA-binding NarL/FixJ family response regulator
MSEIISVFIADDHQLVRMALRTLLEGESDIQVVGEAAATDAAIEGALRLRPDVLVLDMRMPGGGGTEVCRRVKSVAPEIAVLVLTSFDDDEELFGALEAGAGGYLMKDTRPERVVIAVRALHDGQCVFDAGIASRMVAGRTHHADLSDQLSERELDVLGLMARGHSNKDIARELWLGESTVKTHVSHVLRKLGASDRTSAVLAALRAGLVRLEDDGFADES